MKVLLLEDVDNLGYAGDVKDVANGYARNYLIPQQMAVLATSGALNQAETIRKAAEKRRAQETANAEAVANQLEGLVLAFERRAGETGKLYGSVTSADIADAIMDKTEIEVDRRKVALPEPIRALGEQEVTIKLMIDVSTTIKVIVTPEGGILEQERLEELDEVLADEPASPATADEEPVAEETAAETPAAEQPEAGEEDVERQPAEETLTEEIE